MGAADGSDPGSAVRGSFYLMQLDVYENETMTFLWVIRNEEDRIF